MIKHIWLQKFENYLGSSIQLQKSFAGVSGFKKQYNLRIVLDKLRCKVYHVENEARKILEEKKKTWSLIVEGGIFIF